VPLSVNLRHLTRHPVVLKGELSVAELELETHDEMVRAGLPLQHDLEVQLLEDSLLVRGSLRLTLDCDCVRCLKHFQYRLELKDWTCYLPLKGEEKVPVVDDSVDLTGVIREDIFLTLPAHPVCDARCAGLTGAKPGSKKNKGSGPTASSQSAWTELNKLKFRN
jgi:uncharacterized protein